MKIVVIKTTILQTTYRITQKHKTFTMLKFLVKFEEFYLPWSIVHSPFGCASSVMSDSPESKFFYVTSNVKQLLLGNKKHPVFQDKITYCLHRNL